MKFYVEAVHDMNAITCRVAMAETMTAGRALLDAFVPASKPEIIDLYAADGNLYWRNAFEPGHTLDSQRANVAFALESWNQALALCYDYDVKHERSTRVLLRNLMRGHAQLEIPFRRRAEWVHRDIEYAGNGTVEEERQYWYLHYKLAERLGHDADAEKFKHKSGGFGER